jgi:hypothetical protein
MSGSSPASLSRLARAARTFMVGPDQVIDGACRFAGREQPVSHAGRLLLERLLPRLNEVPLAILATPNDLADAAESALLGTGVLVPAVPEPIVEVAAFIDVLLSRLSPCELRDAAVSLGRAGADARKRGLLTICGLSCPAAAVVLQSPCTARIPRRRPSSRRITKRPLQARGGQQGGGWRGRRRQILCRARCRSAHRPGRDADRVPVHPARHRERAHGRDLPEHRRPGPGHHGGLR